MSYNSQKNIKKKTDMTVICIFVHTTYCVRTFKCFLKVFWWFFFILCPLPFLSPLLFQVMHKELSRFFCPIWCVPVNIMMRERERKTERAGRKERERERERERARSLSPSLKLSSYFQSWSGRQPAISQTFFFPRLLTDREEIFWSAVKKNWKSFLWTTSLCTVEIPDR